MDRFGLRTKTEAVDLALRHLVGQPMTREQALAMRGARSARLFRTARGQKPRGAWVILADTSAWIEYERATGSPVDLRLAELIANDGAVVVTELVVMQVLAGARNESRESDLRRLLTRFLLLASMRRADFDSAARIFRRCRAAGVTPRGMVDCTISTVAWLPSRSASV